MEGKNLIENDYIDTIDTIITIINKEFSEGIPLFTNETALLIFYFEKTFKICCKIKEMNCPLYKANKSTIYSELLVRFSSDEANKDLIKSILLKISLINKKNLTQKQDYLKLLRREFDTKKIPLFLIIDKIKEIEKDESNVINANRIHIDQMVNVDIEFFIHFYKLLTQKAVQPFYMFSDIESIVLHSFILSNRNLLKKQNILSSFITEHSNILKSIGITIPKKVSTYVKSLEKEFINIDEEEFEIKKVQLYSLLASQMKDKFYFLFLIDSFYYLLKECCFSMESSMINANNETYFDNILLFFKGFFNSFQIKSDSLIKEMEFSLFNKKADASIEMRTITFDKINKALESSKNKIIKQKYESLKQKLLTMNSDGIIAGYLKHLGLKKGVKIGDLIYDTIKLIPFLQHNYSNTVNILISGFLSENLQHRSDWNKLTMNTKDSEMFFFYQWPSSSIKDILTKISTKFILGQILHCITSGFDGLSAFIESAKGFFTSVEGIGTFFKTARKCAKKSGELLALILKDKKIYGDCTINLIGHSLGSQLIKSCLKTLYLLNKEDSDPKENFKINNVVFLAGATPMIYNTEKWSNIFSNVVKGKIVNCYSNKDEVLKKYFCPCELSQPIGLEEIKINNVVNIDLSDLNMGHLDYKDRIDEIMQRIKTKK